MFLFDKPNTWEKIIFLFFDMHSIIFQEGQYVVEKDFEGVGLTPYSPYHNSSFVYSGKSQHINAKYILFAVIELIKY